MANPLALQLFARSPGVFADALVTGEFDREDVGAMIAEFHAGGMKDLADVLELIRDNPQTLAGGATRENYTKVIEALLAANPKLAEYILRGAAWKVPQLFRPAGDSRAILLAALKGQTAHEAEVRITAGQGGDNIVAVSGRRKGIRAVGVGHAGIVSTWFESHFPVHFKKMMELAGAQAIQMVLDSFTSLVVAALRDGDVEAAIALVWLSGSELPIASAASEATRLRYANSATELQLPDPKFIASRMILLFGCSERLDRQSLRFVGHDYYEALPEYVATHGLEFGKVEIRINIPRHLRYTNDLDLIEVETIFSELIMNGVKYFDDLKDDPFVEVGWDENRRAFVVSDNGTGIVDKVRVWHGFREEERHPGIEGLAIGLVTTREYLERLGWRVELESEVGRGTKFFLYPKEGDIIDDPAQAGGSLME